MRKKHVFLTGEKQVGKSTLLTKVTEDLKIEPAGFITRPYYIENRIKGHYMHSLLPCEENDVPISIRHRKNASLPIRSSFDEFGATILQKSRHQAWILMDELGVLEEEAEVFKAQVFACLDGEGRVLGVLKKADTPFVSQIRKRNDCTILELTQTNRAEVYNQLVAMLK